MDSEQSGQKHGKASHNFPRTAGTASENVAVQKVLPGNSTFLSVRAPAGFLVEEGKGISSVINPRACAAGRHAGRYPFKETCKRG